MASVSRPGGGTGGTGEVDAEATFAIFVFLKNRQLSNQPRALVYQDHPVPGRGVIQQELFRGRGDPEWSGRMGGPEWSENSGDSEWSSSSAGSEWSKSSGDLERSGNRSGPEWSE